MRSWRTLFAMCVRSIWNPTTRSEKRRRAGSGRSRCTESPREISELLPMLTSLWLLPSIYPASKAEQRRKFDFIFAMLDKFGIPLYDESMRETVDRFFEKWPETQNG